jgi:uncharacterized protein (TIGR02145 family)
MKITTLQIALLFFSFQLFSQNITITFSGSGASTLVDSVTAKNLSTNESIILPGNDTLVLKKPSMDVTMSSNYSTIEEVYPNPFFGEAILSIAAKKSQFVQLLLSNSLGQMLARTNQFVQSGNHYFSLNCKKKGIYFISIFNEEDIKSMKIICIGDERNEFNITYQGSAPNNFRKNHTYNEINNNSISSNNDLVISHLESDSKLKSSKASHELKYNVGEIVLYTCKSGNYTTIITDSPTISKNQIVEFVECTDYENNNYPVVQIGTQTWMARNLTTAHYRNGDPLPLVTEDTVWVRLRSGACAVYLNDSSYIPKYGLLYNCYAVIDSRNLCPVGWHAPTDNEWETLRTYLGGAAVAGGKLKESGTDHWSKPNAGASNSSGFSALPSGQRNTEGEGYGKGQECILWSTTTATEVTIYDAAFTYYLNYGYAIFYRNYHIKIDGYAVRCIKD